MKVFLALPTLSPTSNTSLNLSQMHHVPTSGPPIAITGPLSMIFKILSTQRYILRIMYYRESVQATQNVGAMLSHFTLCTVSVKR